ncbi:MAG: sugar phosphate isomerase/epimerase [Candidatus Latescibacteria bacterium]|nr:sugar phosphate isomerase/epimerase [Candidatus Latescibacterota bacterium]
MSTFHSLNRRSFLKSAAIGTAMISASSKPVSASEIKEPRFLFGGFTKTLQLLELSYEEVAEAAAEIGWDGIEFPVRPGGHVLPERVEEDLPLVMEALKKNNVKMLVMVTGIHNPGEPHTEKVLRTASKLGIKRYRIGYWMYQQNIPIPDQLNEIKPQIRDLAALNKELGMCGIYQNHSGRNYVGAPIWDLYELIKDVDSRYIASNFDIGHATVEGGYSWPIQYQLIRSFIGSILVKDFTWAQTPGKGGAVGWCPLGEGILDKSFFKMLLDSGYSGPVSQHFEYEVEAKTRTEHIRNRIEGMKRDGATLRKLLQV